MFSLVKILAVTSVFFTIEACNKIPIPNINIGASQDNRNCGQNCWHGTDGRRKRDVINGVQEALLKFDIRLTEDLATEIKDLNVNEKEQFIQDLEKMNEAVKLEASEIQKDGSINNPEEFLRKISDKVAQDFSGKKWFNRLRSIAGEQIAKLLKEMSQ